MEKQQSKQLTGEEMFLEGQRIYMDVERRLGNLKKREKELGALEQRIEELEKRVVEFEKTQPFINKNKGGGHTFELYPLGNHNHDPDGKLKHLFGE